ncbi:P-loop containing nucleoside triphosphate hydrolase protein [Hymenopellis radicata]|nr:P-loop containing nucleoside triphosphate hydrolase protein [Hymenopellis radicata]
MRTLLEKPQWGTGQAFEGRIVALRKREGIIRSLHPVLGRPLENGLPTFLPQDTMHFYFNFSFLTNPGPSLTMHAAVMSMGSRLSNPHNLVAQRWLFPEPEHLDAAVPTPISTNTQEPWVDTGLNNEQKVVVRSLRSAQTVVEMVHQILRIQPNAHVLVCAPSNSATDTLAVRLAKVLTPAQLFRLNDEKRTFAEVPEALMHFCYVENNHFAIPQWPVLMAKRVVVTSCLDAGILARAYCTNTCLGMLEDGTMNILHPTIRRRIEPHWTHLIIDEAAQGSEPELLVPMTVVLPYCPPPTAEVASPGKIPQLVLCGDPNQLGPIVTSGRARDNELEVSLLERLLNRPLYSRYVKDPALGTRSIKPIANLVKNYRSHPAILMPPSAIFYDDTLEPCAIFNGIITWSGLPSPKIPLKFIGGQWKEECIDERATWFNEGEIDQVVATVTSLLSESDASDPPLRIEEIGVMAPWREQVWKLRERLRSRGLGKVDVGTVEDYQGREMRVIILSCVRSNKRFLVDDVTNGQGLVHERKRMNVAITRAKELLIVIGNGDVLKGDPYWKSFLQFTLRNKLYTGPALDLELDGSYISRLESQLMAHYCGVAPSDEDEGTMLAGGIARELLRDIL